MSEHPFGGMQIECRLRHGKEVRASQGTLPSRTMDVQVIRNHELAVKQSTDWQLVVVGVASTG